MRKLYFSFTFLSESPERNQRGDQGEGRLRSLPSPWNPNSFKRFVCANISNKPPCAIRLPHASVGLNFWTTFSANIVYFRTFRGKASRKCECVRAFFLKYLHKHYIATNFPKTQAWAQRFCRNVRTAHRSIL